MEQTLAAVRECMAKSPALWPQAWQDEYTDTIRQVVIPRQDVPRYAIRLQILRDGFGSYWEGLKKNGDRSPFEVHRAQIRWYVESLMDAELPGKQGKQKLRDQFKDLADNAAHLLLTQFPFLDPNVVQTAKADHLGECYRNIDAPLLPIFRHPLSEEQVGKIKERWQGLRYARVDLWRQLGGDAKTSNAKRDMAPGDAHPHYLLTQRSLAQLRAQIWAIVAPAPDYYRNAVVKDLEAQKQRVRSRSDARAQEQRLGGAVVQTEYLSFLLAALLETPGSFPEEEE